MKIAGAQYMTHRDGRDDIPEDRPDFLIEKLDAKEQWVA